MTAERANFHVGISTDIIFPSLKQQLLLFDRIAVVELQWRITLCKLFAMMFPEDADSHLSEANDLEYLSGLGLVYDPGTPSSYVEQQSKSGYEKEDLANLQEVIRWGELAAETRSVFSDVMDRVKKHGQVFDASTADIDRLTKTLRKYILEKNAEHYFTAKLLSKKLQSVDGLNATPLSANPRTLPKDALLQKSGSAEKVTIVQLVLDKLPLPNDATPWERILEFRNDLEAKGYLFGLRSWMSEVARHRLSPSEAAEKLEWLLFQQSKHLEIHKVASSRKSFGIVFVASAEFLEDIAKFKWGKLAKGIVAFADRKSEISEAEIGGPAKELNYLLRAEQRFGR